MKKWWIHNYEIKTTNQSIVSDIRLGTTSNGPSNSIYDKNQQLVFYLNNKQVRSSNGSLLATLNTGFHNHEYSIVPFIGMEACNDERYFIFYHSVNNINFGLRYIVVKVNKATRVASLDLNETWAHIGTVPIGNSFSPYGGIAVGRELNGKRFLYYTYGNDQTGAIVKLELTKPNNSNLGISPPTIIYNSWAVLYNVMELELSQDGTKLAWGASSTLQNYQSAYVIYLNSLGNYSGVMKQYLLSNINSSFCNSLKGVEFNDNGSMLFIGFPAGGTAMGIYTINLSSNTVQKIPNSDNYAFSSLERGADGRIYVGLVNQSSSILNSFSQTFPYSFGTAISLPLQRWFITNPVNPFMFTDYYTYLPDQIDGEDYEVIPNKISPIAFDINSPVTITGIQYWNGNSNPYSKASINVANDININQGGALAINNMNIKFNLNGRINVNGGILIVDASVFEAIDCSIMWPGINVQNGGIVIFSGLFSQTQTECIIKDAVVGINSNGALNKVDVNHVRFEQNENDVFLFNSAPTNLATISSLSPNTLVRNCNFIHTGLLKDQSKGLEYFSLNTGKKGVSGINISNSLSNITIGPNNNFEGGRYGIYIDKSSVSVLNNNRFFNISGSLNSNFPSTAIRISSNNKNQIINISQANSIFRCQRGIISTGINELDVNGNNFSTTWETAVNVSRNKGGSIKFKNNQFNFCNWEAINLFDNGNSSTVIEVEDNTIKDHPYASGIVIQELFLSSRQSFAKLLVSDNFIGEFPSKKIGQGIIVRNVFGGEGSKSTLSVNLSKSIISSNVIWFSTSLNQNYTGITIENSCKMGIFNNTVHGDNKISTLSSGVLVKNSVDCSVNFNFIEECGSGLRALNFNNNSNYFCNSLMQNRNGINLRDGHIIRNTGQLHGICNQEARHNNFSNSLNADINRTNNVDPNRNQWVFTASNQPILSIESVGGSFTGGTIKASCFGPQECAFPISGSNFEFYDLDGFQPEAFNWNIQMKNTQEAIVYNIPFNLESSFAKLNYIANFIMNGQFDSAQYFMNNFTPSNQVEIDYKDLIEILINSNYPIERPFNDVEVNLIKNMAQLSSYFSGPQVYSARAILKFYFGENYFDVEPIVNDIIGDIHTSCPFGDLNGKVLKLIDQSYNVLPDVNGVVLEGESDLKFYFFGEQLGSLDPNMVVSVFCEDSLFQVPTFKPISEWYNSISSSNFVHLNCEGSNKVEVIDATIKLYPIPSTGFLHVNTDEKLKFELFSSTGAEVTNGEVLNKQINLSHLLKGCYILKLLEYESNQVKTYQKIILID